LIAHNQIMKRAIRSSNLVQRARGNKQFGGADFDAWARQLVEGLSIRSALDLCCGTGNQLLLWASHPECRLVVGVDVSTESLSLARRRLEDLKTVEDVVLEPVAMEHAFDCASIADRRFDLVSCIYGLYYSKDARRTLHQMLEHAAEGGLVLVIGPYGPNNATLFEALERHFVLPEEVVKDSAEFMESVVVPELSKHTSMRIETFVNPIRYPTTKALFDYWKATTFYSAEHEADVMRDFEEHFSTHGEFIVEKHVMACLAQKT